MKLCDSCENRQGCGNLCAAAKEYADQDHVARQEILWENGRDDSRVDSRRVRDLVGPIELGEPEYSILDKANLTDRQKEAVFLHYWAGLNFSQVSRHMGIRLSAVQGHIHRARVKIDAYLKPERIVARIREDVPDLPIQTLRKIQRIVATELGCTV